MRAVKSYKLLAAATPSKLPVYCDPRLTSAESYGPTYKLVATDCEMDVVFDACPSIARFDGTEPPVMVALFVTLVCEPLTVMLIVNAALAFGPRVVPPLLVHVTVWAVVHVHPAGALTESTVIPDGTGSLSVIVPLVVWLPMFVVVSVYVPGRLAVHGPSSVLVKRRSGSKMPARSPTEFDPSLTVC